MSEPRILIFAFEEWGPNNPVNISEIVAEHIDPEIADSANVEVVILPVDDDEIEKIFKEKTAAFQPDYIISMGERNTQWQDSDIILEHAARVFADASTTALEPSVILDHTPLIDYEAVAKKAGLIFTPDEYDSDNEYIGHDNKTEVHLSDDAGYGQCNLLYALSLAYMREQGKEGQALFIHYEDSIGNQYTDPELAFFLNEIGVSESLVKDGIIDIMTVRLIYKSIQSSEGNLQVPLNKVEELIEFETTYAQKREADLNNLETLVQCIHASLEEKEGSIYFTAVPSLSYGAIDEFNSEMQELLQALSIDPDSVNANIDTRELLRILVAKFDQNEGSLEVNAIKDFVNQISVSSRTQLEASNITTGELLEFYSTAKAYLHELKEKGQAFPAPETSEAYHKMQELLHRHYNKFVSSGYAPFTNALLESLIEKLNQESISPPESVEDNTSPRHTPNQGVNGQKHRE